MALTRKFLTALGIESDKVDEIINAHTETVDALKEQRDTYKADAEKLGQITKERDELKKALAEADTGEDYKAELEKVKGEFDSYKKCIEESKTSWRR